MPQDSLCSGAARALGLKKLESLVAAAIARSDWWAVARWQSLTAEIANREAPQLEYVTATMPYFKAALDALGKLRQAQQSVTTEEAARWDNLEMHSLARVLSVFNIDDSRFHPSVDRLVKTPTLQSYPEKVMMLSTSKQMVLVFLEDSGDATSRVSAALSDMSVAGAEALLHHPDPQIAVRCIDGMALGLAAFGQNVTSPRWRWAAFGPHGEALRTAVGDAGVGAGIIIDPRRAYRYDTLHPDILKGNGCDWSLCYSSFSDLLAIRWGAISSASRWMRTVMEHVAQVHQLPAAEFVAESVNVFHVYWSWEQFCELIGDKDPLMAVHRAAGINFHNAADFAHMLNLPTVTRAVGDTTLLPRIWSGDHCCWLLRLCCVLMDPTAISAEELLSLLPTVDAALPLIKTQAGHCCIHIWGGHFANFFLVAARTLEKLGCFEQALPYAARACCGDLALGGTKAIATHILGHLCSGRCQVALLLGGGGSELCEAAEREFEAAAMAAAKFGMWLFEVIALGCCVKLHAQDNRQGVSGGGRGAEQDSWRRLKVAIERLFGGAALSAERLAELGPVLPELDLRLLFSVR
eukprot:SAG31_NODE_6103_length_2171_cov_1.234556_2_plen_579_part_00